MSQISNEPPNSEPFPIEDFKSTLANNFLSLIKTIKTTQTLNMEKLDKEIKYFFIDQREGHIPLEVLKNHYNSISRLAPNSKTNRAKLASVKQIINLIDKYNSKNEPPPPNSLLEFAMESMYDKLTEINVDIQNSKYIVTELENKKQFMLTQINCILSSISKDLDNYITTSLNLNDPVELDKTDKRMIRSVIDITHVANALNVDIKKKYTKQ